MKPLPKTWLRFRITLLLGLFSFLFAVAWARAYQLQVLQSPKLAILAERQYQHIVPLIPRRGILYDRKREEMAVSVEVDSVFAQPGKIANIKEAASKIASVIDKHPGFLLKKMKEEKPFIWLERGITAEQRTAIEKLGIRGVDFLKETKRFYPQGETGCHVIGFSGVDSQGLEGVELEYDEFIRGEPGYILISKDALGRTLDPESPEFQHSEAGSEVVLTLDKNIQYITEKELQKAVQNCSAQGGMAIVMDPKTGEILGMAVEPAFDPNRFSSFPAQTWKNRTITDAFEPGSTLKIFLLAAALEEREVVPGDMFFCENGAYALGRRVIHDVHKFKWLSLEEVIKFSSNIGASKVGKKLGKVNLHRYLRNFGLGSLTHVDLPGEVTGNLPLPQQWSEVGLANISFGQGVSITALQLTAALAAIANGGILMRPYVVQSVLGYEGNILHENRPQKVRRVISEQTAKAVTQILRTVLEEGGTGRAAALAGYEAAGKTGTAQKASLSGRGYSDKRVSSFIGFAPLENPRVVITVVIDEPQGINYGGVVAAPAFKAIGEQVLSYIGVYPQGVTYLANAGPPASPSATQTVADSAQEGMKQSDGPLQAEVDEGHEEPGVMPNFSGKSIRQVVQTAQRLGLELNLVGSGRAVAQTPAPGEVLQGEKKGVVRFQPSL